MYEKGVKFHSVSLWMCSLYYSQQTRVIIMNSCEILWIIWLPQRNRTYVQTKTYTLMIIHNHQRMYVTHIKGSLDKHSVVYPDNKDHLAKKRNEVLQYGWIFSTVWRLKKTVLRHCILYYLFIRGVQNTKIYKNKRYVSSY